MLLGQSVNTGSLGDELASKLAPASVGQVVLINCLALLAVCLDFDKGGSIILMQRNGGRAPNARKAIIARQRLPRPRLCDPIGRCSHT
eukprot:9502623-Pyramimonas_sp.AAC.1